MQKMSMADYIAKLVDEEQIQKDSDGSISQIQKT